MKINLLFFSFSSTEVHFTSSTFVSVHAFAAGDATPFTLMMLLLASPLTCVGSKRTEHTLWKQKFWQIFQTRVLQEFQMSTYSMKKLRYKCWSVDPTCHSPTPNSTDVNIPQCAVSKCPLTQNISTPKTEVRYSFKSFVLNFLLLALSRITGALAAIVGPRFCSRSEAFMGRFKSSEHQGALLGD